MLVAFTKRQRTREAVREVTTSVTTTAPATTMKKLQPTSATPAATRGSSARKPRTKTPASDTAYAPAFARVRLVRAWIGVAAATVALGYAFAALLDRLLP